MYSRNDLIKIKDIIKKNIGKKVTLVSNKSRKNNKVGKGSIVSAYPSVFVVKLELEDTLEAYDKIASYSYTDLLTKTVELFLCPNDENTENMA